MRPLRLATLSFGLLMAWPLAAQPQDFDPTGRQPQPRGPGPGPGPRRPPNTPPAGPSTDALIARYTSIVMAQPGAAFPLQKLTQLYRERDGKLDKLIEDLEKRAATPGAEQLSAQLALAGVYGHAHRKDDALVVLAEVVKANPRLAAPHQMLAEIAASQGDKATARKHYEAAMPLVTAAVDKERLGRTLMELCLDLKDYDAAEKYHQALYAASGRSLFVLKELGVALMNRGDYARAEKELRKVLAGARGDFRAEAPALRDLGAALAKQKKMDEALKVLKEARVKAGSAAGIRREILALLTDVFREQGNLAELITVLEEEGGRDFERLVTIGSLYEETGQVDKALATYKSALQINRGHVDTRVKLVHLLQTAGQLDEAITEYEALIKAAPHNADFVFELAETLIQRGDRQRALKLVSDLERRTAREADILAAVADFYERIEEHDRALGVFERLAKLSTGDPRYLIDLGDRYFQAGDKARALATWAKISTVVRNRAMAQAMLGEVYLEHDMPDMAIEALNEAVKLAPTQLRYKKQLAIAYERTAAGARSHGRYADALRLWHELLGEAGSDPVMAREARTHIVSLWSLMHVLKNQVAPLQARLDRNPPDLDAGRLLGEVQRRLGKLPDALVTLRKLTTLAPGDEESWLAIERVLLMQRDLDGAIAVLEKLVEVNPRRARQFYQRMAQYAAELYRDDDAIKYAARAVELSPDDAAGHHRLGQMYNRRQDTTRAIVEFRKAIQKNDKLFAAYFDLAELLLAGGDVDGADRLYRTVVRTCRDEELVVRGARQSMQINLGKNTLASLERELLPVALGNPQKAVYRRLLVELYGAMTFPLVHAARLGTTAAAKEARTELGRIGARAVKPLLDALTDEVASQQRVAIEVLAYVQNTGAGPALFNFATGQADQELRVRAMVAVGALNDASLLPRYQKLLAGDDAPGDAVAVAAAWGVARMDSPKAEPLLRSLLASASPDIRALAALGLGLTGNEKDLGELTELARSAQSGPVARAAAVHALGELGQEHMRPQLLALTSSAELPVRLAAMLALARLEAERTARGAPFDEDVGLLVARALVEESPEVRRTAMAAATAMTSGNYRRGEAALPVPDGAVVVGDVLRGLAPTGYSRAEQVAALVALGPLLVQAAVAAVATSPERAAIVAEMTMTTLEPAIDAPVTDEVPERLQRELGQTADAIAKASVGGFVALARHPSLQVQKRAIELLAGRPEAEAQAAVIHALGDDNPEVVKTALSSVGKLANPEVLAAVVRRLREAESWSIRARAAEALGRAGEAAGGDEARDAVRHAALKDAYALVREAAVRAAAGYGGDYAKQVLDEVARADSEPRLRQLATELGAVTPG